MTTLTVARLKHFLHYDPVVGVFIRKTPNGTAKAGDIAGYVRKDGYIGISVDGMGYVAHRLAWLYMNGRWPPHHTDHINRIKSDNRIANLREATARQNCGNTQAQVNNTSGVKGVYWSRVRRKWVAQIGVGRRVINLGGFDQIDDAIEARKNAEISIQGEFRCQS